MRVPTFRAALASNFAAGWTVYGVRVALVPLFVVEVLQRPGSWSGIALTAFAAGTGATLFVGGRWADRRGRRSPILVGSDDRHGHVAPAAADQRYDGTGARVADVG